MAQKIQTLFIDDLDGSAAEGTVRFSLDGTEYEIDLNAKHAHEFRDALARYVAAARRDTVASRPTSRPTAAQARPGRSVTVSDGDAQGERAPSRLIVRR